MKVIVIDGQGGKVGKIIVEELKKVIPEQQIIAIGTNSIATSVMLKAGADLGATGENPVIYNANDADIIIGSMGILVANSYLGEITPSMALAISESIAEKLLIPINRCNISVVGTQEMPYSEYAKIIAAQVKNRIDNRRID
jgi:hypothetical protein